MSDERLKPKQARKEIESVASSLWWMAHQSLYRMHQDMLLDYAQRLYDAVAALEHKEPIKLRRYVRQPDGMMRSIPYPHGSARRASEEQWSDDAGVVIRPGGLGG